MTTESFQTAQLTRQKNQNLAQRTLDYIGNDNGTVESRRLGMNRLQKFGKRVLALALATGVGIAGVGKVENMVDAHRINEQKSDTTLVYDYQDDKSVPDDKVALEIPADPSIVKDPSAYHIAGMVTAKGLSPTDETMGHIEPQVDIQQGLGANAGDIVILDREDVKPEIQKAWAPKP